MKFENLARRDLCTPAPNSSHVVVADVRQSTRLIEVGRQRQVNLVGAACIAAIRNSFPRGRIPFVFGGDGATFLVEDADLSSCLEALCAVQAMAEARLGIGLRVGSVSVQEILDLGAEVYHGAIEAGAEDCMAFLRGDGIVLADRLIKQRDVPHSQATGALATTQPNITGLSCRLLPFESQRGVMTSTIIEPCVTGTNQDGLFEELFRLLEHGGSLERFCPVKQGLVRHKWISALWKTEAKIFCKDNRMLARIQSFPKAFIESLLTRFVFKFDKYNSMTGLPSRYISEVPSQSDWIKASGALYLTLDMTRAEADEMSQWLGRKEQEGFLRFGTSSSSCALLTCHLHRSSKHRHLHFVDGGDGGLTAAASQLKAKRSTNKGPILVSKAPESA